MSWPWRTLNPLSAPQPSAPTPDLWAAHNFLGCHCMCQRDMSRGKAHPGNQFRASLDPWMLPNAMLPKVIFRKKKQPNNEKHNSRMHIILFSQGSKDGSFQGQSLSPSSQGSQVKRQSVLQHEGGQPTVFPPRCSYADILQVKPLPVSKWTQPQV